LWSIFTISASALLALVVPATIYWFKYNRPLRISSGYIKIAAVSAIGVVCSILIEPIGDFFLLIAMTYTTSVACGFSQEATIFFEECLIPMSWSLVTGSWFRQGKSPVARADATKGAIEQLPSTLISPRMPMDSEAPGAGQRVEFLKLTANSSVEDCSIKLEGETPLFVPNELTS
jgi:hypothetical protein